MSNLDSSNQFYIPTKFEWVLFGLALLLILLLGCRFVDPLFLDGQLLPSMAGAFLPGAVCTLFKRPALAVHRMCFALGLLVFLVANGTIKPSEIAGALENWPWVALGIVILSLQILTGALRWVLLLTGQGIKLTFTTAVRLLTVGFFFNTFIPGSTGGDFYRIYKVAKEDKSLVAPVTTTVFLDRLLGLPTLLILAITGIWVNIDFIRTKNEFMNIAKGYGVFTIGCILFFAILFYSSFFLAERLRRCNFTTFIGRGFLKAVESIEVYKNNKSILVSVILVSIISHLSTFAAFLCFGKAVGIEGLHVSILLFLIFAGLVVNFIPLAPGGAGQGELAFAWIFGLASPGFPENAHRAAVMMLCYRLGLLVYGAIGGIMYGVSRQEILVEKNATPETDSAS